MVARRTFLRYVAALPAGALAARALVACDDDSTAAATDTRDAADTAEVAPDTVAPPDTTAPDTLEPDTTADTTADTADTSEPDVADTAQPDTADTTEPDTAPRVCSPTTGDAQGPYYLAGAPAIVDLSGTEPGTPLDISGQVLDTACEPIAGAKVEVWQADDAGDYYDDRMRGTLTCNAQGAYAFSSIMPGRYLQATGFRPAHLHYKVSAPGYRTIVTQIYFAGDPYLQPNDSCSTCASDDPARILALVDVAGRKTSKLDVTLRTA